LETPKNDIVKNSFFCIYFQNAVENYTTDFGFPQTLVGYTYWLQKSRGIFLKSALGGADCF